MPKKKAKQRPKPQDTYSFPSLGKSVLAESLEEAKEKVRGGEK